MHISTSTYKYNQKISFGRALTTDEKAEFSKVAIEAKEKIGNTGKSILIVHDPCLPQSSATNTGVGNLGSKKADEFFDFMKSYTAINTVEVLPQGEILPNGKPYFCPYDASALSLGSNQIDLEKLTTSEFGEILNSEEFESVVKANEDNAKETMANYENVIGKNNSQDKVLRKAFDRFKNSDNPKAIELKKQFIDYKGQNKDWLEPKGIFSVLKDKYQTVDVYHWTDELDKKLYSPEVNKETAAKRISEILEKNADDVDFYNFKQFLADEHLKLGRENLNKKGIKLIGDCLIGFSRDEVWANPNAFLKDTSIGWGLPALDLNQIKDESSPAAKLLKKKVELFAKRYDSIRFDVSWSYVKPALTKNGKTINGDATNQGSHVLEFIEKTVKEVKGKDFDLKDLIHEVEASWGDFQLFDKSENLIDPYKDRTKIFGTMYMSDDWGSTDAFKNRRGFSLNEFVIGPGNHDPLSLRELAEANNPSGEETVQALIEQKQRQINPLARALDLDKDTLDNPIAFIKAKFAEPYTAKNNMMFYMDVFGRSERFDSQGKNDINNFRYKIPENFENSYHTAVQEGHGFNLMDSLEKVFKAKGLDEQYSSLYESICKFKNILYEKGVTTEAEANTTIAPPVKTVTEAVTQVAEKSNKKIIAPIIALIAFAGAAASGLTYYLKNKKTKTQQNTQPSATTITPKLPVNYFAVGSTFKKFQ